MNTVFHIPRITADRLARLPLACADESGPLGHIGVRVTPTAVRFAATNGRILASLVVPIDVLTGDAGDVIFDAAQFATALKAAAKATGGRIQIEIGPKEARLTNGTASAIVRRVDGTFPRVEHVWSRTAGRQWVPTISSLDPVLLATAQKISGHKNPLLFSSPVDPAARLDRLWAVPGATAGESLDLAQARQAVIAPAYWADHELAILVMPVTRTAEQRQLDLQVHAVSLPESAAVAA
ncbi:MAG: hypothetical protein J0M02_01060 [Planctomycetes bacterium]|nr:hypothetical protein [Planctomycetota bacterium]